jgi:hypothetical protein
MKEKIKQLRQELDDLELEYMKQLNPCINKECTFNRDNKIGCTWTLFIEDCKDYIYK